MRSNEKFFALSKKKYGMIFLFAKDGQKITPNGHFLFQNGTKYKQINNYNMLSASLFHMSFIAHPQYSMPTSCTPGIPF